MSKNPIRWALYLLFMGTAMLAATPFAYAIDGREGLRNTWHTFWMYAPTDGE